MKNLTFLNIIMILIIIMTSFSIAGCKTQSISSKTTTGSSVKSIIRIVKWNLAGEVMPNPENGSQDVLGSDSSSVLTISQAASQIQITGKMDGLKKNTTYIVSLAKSYSRNTQYPGQFSDKIVPFTFLNDPTGVFNWTFIMLNSYFPGPGAYTLSIWIYDVGTNTAVLISDNFNVNIK